MEPTPKTYTIDLPPLVIPRDPVEVLAVFGSFAIGLVLFLAILNNREKTGPFADC